jgi:hypothetical protein
MKCRALDNLEKFEQKSVAIVKHCVQWFRHICHRQLEDDINKVAEENGV